MKPNEMKKILLFLTLLITAISCLQEKGGVLPIEETLITGNDGGTSPGGGVITGADSSISAALCGLSATANLTTAAGEVCFDTQILPMIVSNCAQSGCHDSKSKKDGYDLTTYDKIVSKGIVKGNAGKSEIYKVMIETGKDRMPPSPQAQLSAANLKLVADWINQGAKNTVCQTNGTGSIADTVKISYLTHLKPVLDTYCVGCHSAASASGNIRVDNYANLKTIADNGKLYGSIAQLSGFSAMPTSGKLSDCQIKAFKQWIDQGSLNN